MAIADNQETTYSTTYKRGLFHNLLHDLRKSLRGNAHSLSEIRQEMNLALRNESKLTDVLKHHHGYLKESLVICLDQDSKDSEKQKHLDRLLQLFEMHAKAEEQTLYKLLIAQSEKKPRLDGSLAQDEHDLIYSVMDDLRDMHFSSLWTEDVESKNLLLCELMVSHLKKEEDEIFPLADEAINSGQLNDLTADYISLCENHLSMSEIRAKGIFL